MRRFMRHRFRLYAFSVLAFAAQLGFWWQTREKLPEMTIVPDVPGRETLQAMSFGDTQFLFRVMALRIQTAGDTFGQTAPLYQYDYSKLYMWLSLLTEYDRTSNVLPAIVSYYYSQTQFRPDIRYLTRFLDEYAASRPQEKWWWLTQAVYLASHRLGDKDLALALASKLEGVRGIPVWAQQMPAFIHEQRGEFGDALAIMEAIRDDIPNLPEGERVFIQRFIEERVHAVEKAGKKP